MNLTDKRFHDEAKARKWLEQQRWPDGVHCTHCGSFSVTSLRGKAHRDGLYQCNDCRKQFSVTTGSVMERTRMPLNKWVAAMYMMSASKKGVSAHQLHRTLGITYQSAWFMAHRIREAMKDADPAPMGGGGKIVEADETYVGNAKGSRRVDVLLPGKGWVKRNAGTAAKFKVVSLVERGGRARSVHVRSLTTNTVGSILRRNVIRKTTHLVTDKARAYEEVGREFASHSRVDHGRYEWARGDIHTNTIEGFFSIFKRGMRGVYQHCSEAHLQRYLHEFDFRYTHCKISDAERAGKIVRQSAGKRLTYRRTDDAAYA